jgi:hypothetical protein
MMMAMKEKNKKILVAVAFEEKQGKTFCAK